MRIGIIGTGYVGLVTGVCFSEMGNNIICVDIDEKKIKKLKLGKVPIYEPELEEILKKNLELGNLEFTTDIKTAVQKSDILFIAVGTPMGEDGSADLKYVLSVAKSIGKYINHPLIVVDKSTVPVGTAELVRETIQKELRERKVDFDFHVVSNPEFLKEGAAVDDFMKPDRIVIGSDSEKATKMMREIYAPFTRNHERLILMDIKSAEMTKYAANSMLATKISFINEISNICEKVGADINKVRLGIGSDSRIGHSFIYPGCGYGGSCFPKDVKALQKLAQEYKYETLILNSVQEVNKNQKMVLPKKVIRRFGKNLSKLTFAVWGLSFKPETDDMRDASSIIIIDELTKRGAKIQAYDPKAMHEAQACYLKKNSKVTYCKNKQAALKGVDALILITEWKEFRSPDFEKIKKAMKQNIIFDGRNIYDRKKMEEDGFEYYGIGF